MKNDMATELFGNNTGSTGLVQQEGKDPLWHDGSGQMRTMTPSMWLFHWYTRKGVLLPQDGSEIGPIRTLDGIFEVNAVWAGTVRLLLPVGPMNPTLYTNAQITAMKFYPPPTKELIGNTLYAAIDEMKSQPPIEPPNPPIVETPKGPFGSASPAVGSSRKKVAKK